MRNESIAINARAPCRCYELLTKSFLISALKLWLIIIFLNQSTLKIHCHSLEKHHRVTASYSQQNCKVCLQNVVNCEKYKPVHEIWKLCMFLYYAGKIDIYILILNFGMLFNAVHGIEFYYFSLKFCLYVIGAYRSRKNNLSHLH